MVMFYHLTRHPLEAVLSDLLPRSLAKGWRVVVRGKDPAHMARLDEALWITGEESFLPHGLAGSAHDAQQPVLLTTGTDVPNKAQCLMTCDSAVFDPAEAANFERTCILFDGHNETALAFARGQWRQVKEAGIKAEYWSEDSGRWEKKAET